MLASYLVAALAASDVVQTKDGPVRGTVTNRYRSFRGLPFAAPPLGKLRFAPPAPVEPWSVSEARDATEYKHNCIQGTFDPAQPRDTLSEDCLYLNVWTPPNATASSRLPVFFWVHGGGYTGGGSNESRLNGTWNAAKHEVVMVVTNYRLNVFGFLGSEELRQRDPKGGTGNAGILDQRAALQWVQDNIGAFGGDATRVLLAGESAGGASVYNHLVRPESWGLFSRALPESGGYTLMYAQPEPKDFEAGYRHVLNRTGCATAGPTCLDTVDADTLFRAGVGTDLQPSVDGVDLAAQISTLLAQGKVAPGVPMVVGAVREDMGYPIWGTASTAAARMDCAPEECAQADFERFVRGLQPTFSWNETQVRAAIDAYSASEVALPGGPITKWTWAGQHLGADFCMICTARRSAAAVAAAGAKTWLYLFAHAPDGPSGKYPALAHHSSEIPFVFHDDAAIGPDAPKYHFSPREAPLADAMAGAWVEFAASGEPPSWWPEYSSNQAWAIFGDVGGVEPALGTHVAHGLKGAQCDLWDATKPGKGRGLTTALFR